MDTTKTTTPRMALAATVAIAAHTEYIAFLGTPGEAMDTRAADSPLAWQFRLTDGSLSWSCQQQRALEIIEALHRAFAADDAERCVEALGAALVASAKLASIGELAITSITALARDYTKRQDLEPLFAGGAIAAVALASGRADSQPLWHPDRGASLVDALAMGIANAVDDCEIGHDLTINLDELFVVVARERFPAPIILADASFDAFSAEVTSPPKPNAKLRELAIERLQVAAADLEVAERAETVETGGLVDYDIGEIAELSSRHARILPTRLAMGPLRGEILGLGDYLPSDEEKRIGIAGERVCPDCAAPMSEVPSTDLWRCANNHEHKNEHLSALRSVTDQSSLDAAPPSRPRE